jgi:hypothetical protein
MYDDVAAIEELAAFGLVKLEPAPDEVIELNAWELVAGLEVG